MRKAKVKNLSIYFITACILIISLFSITEISILSKNKMKEQMIKNYIKELQILSTQIKNNIHYEMEDFAYMLEIIKKSVVLDFNSLEKTKNALKNMEEKGTFTSFGVVTPQGNGINTNGYQIKVDFKSLEKNFFKYQNKEKYYFVSNVFSEEERINKDISIGIPIFKNNKLQGFLFGRQPIEKLSEKVNSSLDEGMYFQILDSNGIYIDSSSNKFALSDGSKTLWEELEKHKGLFEDCDYDKIIKDIKGGKKGFFTLNDSSGGRYVIYEPLGINNWYIFSVITKEKINLVVKDLQEISTETLNRIIFLVVFIIGTIVCISFYVYEITKKQKDKSNIFKILANKTKDIFFEVHLSEEIFILYNFSEDNKKLSFSLNLITPENMLAKNKIKERDLEVYKEIHRSLLEKRNIEKLIIELSVKNIWRWFRVSSISFNDDNIIGILEDFTKEQTQGTEIVEINEKSKYDFLTGLYNRETFEKEFNNFINTHTNFHKKNFLIILDLDNFKKINDNLGHIMGDTVLKETANSLKTHLKSSDIIGRMGGDEFIILVKNLDSLEQIEKIANRLNKTLVKTYKNITVSSSIGIAEIKQGSSLKEIYNKADKALYKVKDKGKNSYFIEE